MSLSKSTLGELNSDTCVLCFSTPPQQKIVISLQIDLVTPSPRNETWGRGIEGNHQRAQYTQVRGYLLEGTHKLEALSIL